MRIVAGTWRGRTLAAPPGEATRPTADRVRQALFDILLHAPWGGREAIDGVRVLDAFAGTGALGLEALSRGAAHATFIERDHAAIAVLRANVAALGAEDRTRVIAGDVLAPPRAEAPCGLVFLDPPYGNGALPPAPSRKGSRGHAVPHSSPPPAGGVGAGVAVRDAVAALAAAGWIAPGALIVAETARDARCPAPHVPLVERAHGAARITVWRA